MSDRLLALALALLILLTLLLTATGYGITYDEVWYMSQEVKAAQWLGALLTDPAFAVSAEGVGRYWEREDYQPGLVKLVGGVALSATGGILPVVSALRSGTSLLCAILAGCLYLWVTGVWGRAAGLFAVGALFLTPSVFAHAHLLALDAPIMALSALTLMACWMAARSGKWGWVIITGALWGLALNTKLNAFFIPFIIFPWLVLYHRRLVWKIALSMAVLGPLAMFLTWPLLWHDTLATFMAYLRFHLAHGKVAVTYFGTRSDVAPWHFPLVMTLITTPPMVLVLFAVGLGRLVRWPTGLSWGGRLSSKGAPAGMPDGAGDGQPGRLRLKPVEREMLALAAWACLVNILPSSLPDSPKYNGVRLFLPLFPPMAVVGAAGFAWVAGYMRAETPSLVLGIPDAGRKAVGLLLVLCLLGPLVATAGSHPYQMSYYNVFIGGLRGAAARGMEPTYWGDTYLAGCAWLSRNARPGSLIWVEPPGIETIIGRTYKTLGVLRQDLRTTAGPDTLQGADYAITQNKPTEHTDATRWLIRTQRPAFTDGLDGVPLIYVFDLRAIPDLPEVFPREPRL